MNAPQPQGSLLIRAENNTRLLHIVNELNLMENVSVPDSVLRFPGKPNELVQPFQDIYGNDMILMTLIYEGTTPKEIFRSLDLKMLCVNTLNETNFLPGHSSGPNEMAEALMKCTPVKLDDCFKNENLFPQKATCSPENAKTENEVKVNEACDYAKDVAVGLLKDVGEVNLTLITYPSGKHIKPMAFGYSYSGDELEKDQITRHMANQLLRHKSDLYTILTETWGYEVVNGVPDRSKRTEGLQILTVHRSGTVAVRLLDVTRDNKEVTFIERTQEVAGIGGRFAYLFDLLPVGYAAKKQESLHNSLASKNFAGLVHSKVLH